MSLESKKDKIEKVARQNGGYIRLSHALKAGIDRRTFYGLRDAGFLNPEGPGLYSLSDTMNPAPDLVVISQRIPRGIISLVSALAFHDMTTQIPHRVYISVPRGIHPEPIEYPPVETHQVSGQAYSEGVEIHDIGGVKVPIYNVEKTIADCFKFRSTVGLDVALEGLKMARDNNLDIAKLFRYARICRVSKIISPYVEAIA